MHRLIQQFHQSYSMDKSILEIPSTSAVFNFGQNFYGQTPLTPNTLADFISSSSTWQQLLSFHHLLATDEYVTYVDNLYRHSRDKFGESWKYFDITNVIFGSALLLQPENYLEIGVRRGRSVCCLAKASPNTNIYACDMWVANYAGIPNPGPEFVSEELARFGFLGKLDFINGNSHETLPELRNNRPDLYFDMITVDGDHSADGAMQDLEDVFPRLKKGGVLVFDDISHPSHPYLGRVWKSFVAKHPELKSFEYSDLGYGVAFAIKGDSLGPQ